jgi:hypothetical protein
MSANRPFREISTSDYERSIPRNECYFYHTIDLPQSGLIRGHWDLRNCESDYLGDVDVRNKTFFDCGVATGYMAFEMERRGAYVIGLDLDVEQSVDMGLVPFSGYKDLVGHSWAEAVNSRRDAQRRLRHSFLFSRRELDSKVRLFLGNLMESPIDEIADGALLGAILLHLRDPIAALYNVAKSVRETIIICDTLEIDRLNLDDPPQMLFRPSISDPRNVGTWWYSTPSLLKCVLEIVGFRLFHVTKHLVKDDVHGVMAPHFTLVARR